MPIDTLTVRACELVEALRTFCDVDQTLSDDQLLAVPAFAVSDDHRCSRCEVATATAVVQSDPWDAAFARLCGLCIYEIHGA